MSKKIVAYIGTKKGKTSNTYKLVKEILNRCKEKSEEIEFEIITSNDVAIKPCIGCEKCFISGLCPLDKTDEAGELKDKILSADMVIFASPVYAHNVSGDMKIFIDRISYWLHNMKLNRKYAAVISTTASNGHLTVISYLEKIMLTLGAKILFKINCALTDIDEFGNADWINVKADELSEKILNAFNTKMISNNSLEIIFKLMKERYNNMEKSDCIIDNFKEAEEIGLLASKTYQDFLDTYFNKYDINNLKGR